MRRLGPPRMSRLRIRNMLVRWVILTHSSILIYPSVTVGLLALKGLIPPAIVRTGASFISSACGRAWAAVCLDVKQRVRPGVLLGMDGTAQNTDHLSPYSAAVRESMTGYLPLKSKTDLP